MASIGPVSLQIVMNTPVPGEAHIKVRYTVEATSDDIAVARSYRELVQLVSEGTQIGEPGVEHPVPGGTMRDGVLLFFGETGPANRELELKIPMSALKQGASALESDAVRARVSLTALPPLSPTRESNVVQLNQPPTTQQ